MFKFSVLPVLIFLSSCSHIIQRPEPKLYKTPTVNNESNPNAEENTHDLSEDLSITPKEEVAQDEDKLQPEPIETGSFTHSYSFLKNIKNENVKFWIKYFTQKDKERFIRFHQNGERFRPLIESILEDHGLPKDLYFVGLIESGYYLGAKSRVGATGPWQFMPGTAKNYGLVINNKIDERRNIIKATHAAARFFQDLHNIFGSWELALSAYNAGEYGIIRRIRNAKTRDFYELSAQKKLPKETIHYVPKILAAMEIIKNAKQYNIPTHFKAETIYNEAKAVRITKRTTLNQLSTKHNIDLAVLKKLNPDLSSTYIPRLRSGVSIYVPSNKLSKSLVAQEDIEVEEVTVTQQNNKYASKKITRKSSKKYFKYKVRKGDNLYTLARKHNTAISKIMSLNRLRKKSIYYGQILKIPAVKKIYYTVKRGDYLNKIARQYGLSLDEIKALNSIKKEIVIPGQKLLVKVR